MAHATLRPAEQLLLELADVPPAARMAWLARRCEGAPSLLADVQVLIDQMESPEDSPSDRIDVRAGAAVGSADRLLAPGTTIDDFTIVGLLGAGAAGVAYLARQAAPPRDVALKMLRPSRRADARRRFELEGDVLARLDHPGIASIYVSRAERDHVQAYIAMELVDGIPATDFAESHDLGVNECLLLVARICDAVHHAHQRGVIHRDIKPANILVTVAGQPKVLDFGVARLVDGTGLSTSATQVGQLVGTLPYMSPEQVAGDPADLDIRTDVYALGVLLYHMLTRRLPFDFSELNLTDAVQAISAQDPRRLISERPDLDGDVSIIVGCAMARARERRYPSAAALADDLRRAAGGVPIAAHRDSAWRNLRDRLRRSRLVATAAAAGLIGVAGLAGYAIVQRGDARETADALARQLARATVERGRLLARMGNLPVAETLLWRQTQQGSEDAATHWALRELYARYPSVWETQAHIAEVHAVCFSPDERHVLSGGRDGRVQLSQARDGAPVRHWLDHPAAGVASVGFASGGRWLYSIGRDGRVVTREVATGVIVAEWGLPSGRVQDAVLSVSGDLLAVVSEERDGELFGAVYAASLTEGVRRTLWSASAGLAPMSVAHSPDGRTLVVGSNDGRLTTLDAATGVVRWQRSGQQSEVGRVAWSHDGRWLATGGSDRAVRVWDAATGDVRQTLSSGNGTSRSVAFSPDSRRVVSAGWWRVDVWDVATGELLGDDIGASQGWFDARYSTSGERLLLGSGQGSVRLWDIGSTLVLRPAMPTEPLSVSFDSDRAALHPLIGRSDGHITLIDPGGAPHHVRHGVRLNQLAVDASGLHFASVGAEPMLRTWRRGDNRVVPQVTVEAGDGLSVAMSRDGRLVAVGEAGGRLTVISTDDGRTVLRIDGDGNDLLAVRFIAGGTRMVTAYRDRQIVVRDVADGRPVTSFESSAAPFTLAYHDDSQRLAAGTWAGAIDVWALDTGQRVTTLTGHARVVTDLDFLSADVLCSTGRDGTVRVWGVDDSSELALLLQRVTGGEGVRVVDDGHRLAVVFEDGHAELIDLARLDARIEGHRRVNEAAR